MNRIGWMKKLGAGLAVVLLCAPATARAGEQELMEKIKALETRLTQLEGSSLNASNAPSQTLEFLGKTTFSGFASASFFHNFNDGAPGAGAGTYVTKNDQFAINKFKLALEKPVDYDKDKWNVGFRMDGIVGEDAKRIHAAGLGTSEQPFDLEQAYVNINIPVGNGLKVAIGKMVTLMGVEVVEETTNPNWTIGNQFLFVENTTQLGGLISYKFTDKVEAQFAVLNGWDKVTDNNNALSYMGKINLMLSDKTSVALLGYGGPEQDSNTSNWRKGAEIVVTQKVGSKLTLYGQLDYGEEDLSPGVFDAKWYAAGLWAVYQFHDKVSVALRGDYLVDDGATRTAYGPAGSSPNLTSLTATLNYSPIKNLQIRPEIRWDHCSKDAFTDKTDAKNDQVLIGAGVAYLF
jgi:hypothetical protein